MGMYLLAGVVGFIFGTAVAYGNMQITRRSVLKNTTAAIMVANMLRFLVNVAALAIVFFLRKVIPMPFNGTIIGTALGLSICGIFFNYRLNKTFDSPKSGNTESTEEPN